jgi:hypothetical protein
MLSVQNKVAAYSARAAVGLRVLRQLEKRDARLDRSGSERKRT